MPFISDCFTYQFFYLSFHMYAMCGGSVDPLVCGSSRLHDRYFTHARLLDDGRLGDNDKMFILKAFTPLQAPGCLTLAQIDS